MPNLLLIDSNKDLCIDICSYLRSAGTQIEYVLDAETALFHHAPGPDGDLRIELHLRDLGEVLLVVEEIEPSNLEGTVVGAITGSDTPVVDHRVEAVLGVLSRCHRAHLLAWGHLALHAGHRLESHLSVIDFIRGDVIRRLEVTIQSNPMHFSLIEYLLPANHRNIILCLAGNDTGVAARTGVEINRHSPLLTLVLFFLPQGYQGRMVIHMPEGLRVLKVLIDRGLTGQLSDSELSGLVTDRIDRPVGLRCRQLILSAG